MFVHSATFHELVAAVKAWLLIRQAGSGLNEQRQVEWRLCGTVTPTAGELKSSCGRERRMQLVVALRIVKAV